VQLATEIMERLRVKTNAELVQYTIREHVISLQN
jgi:hypothetical protein